MKVRITPNIGVFVVAVVTVLGFIFSWHFFGKMDPYTSLMPGSAEAGQVPILLTDVDVRARGGGLLLWKVSASHLTISADRQTISGDGLSNGVLYKSGMATFLFSAQRIACAIPQFSRTPNINISGRLDLWSTGAVKQLPVALQLTTSNFDWNGLTGIADCPFPVFFSAPNLGFGSVTGLTVDSSKKTLHFAQIAATTDAALTGGGNPDLPITKSTIAPSQAGGENDSVSYETTDGYWDENNQTLTVKGPITFHQGKAEVEMTGAVFDDKTKIAVSSSPVKITDTDVSSQGDHGSIDFSKHLAILTGNITMLVLPKPEDKVSAGAVKKPTTILCDQVVYDYRAKKAHTIGEVTIKQPGRVVTADDGQYDVTLKIIDLVGHVVGKSADGKLIKAPHAKVSVDPKDEWLQLDGPITGSIPVSSSDNPLASDKGSTTQSAGPASAQAPLTAPSPAPASNTSSGTSP